MVAAAAALVAERVEEAKKQEKETSGPGCCHRSGGSVQ
jgi:hypothetical protein